MAWLDWLFGKQKLVSSEARSLNSGVLSSQQMDSSRTMMGGRLQGTAAQPAAAASAQRLEQRRTERNAKRELLFQVVRESMVRVGVLSSAFKFKVLSLDQRGRSFLVMIELSAEFSGEVEKLAEIESMIAQTARHRFEIVVQAVYWRYFNTSNAPASTLANSQPAPLLGATQAPLSRPAPLFGLEAAGNTPATAASSAPVAAAIQKSAGITGSFPIIGATDSQKAAATAPRQAAAEELSEDEVAAFRRALAAGAVQGEMAAPAQPSAAPAVKTVVVRPAPPSPLEAARSKLLLTGYEDTEMPDDEPMPALSGTQYGELR